VRARWWRHWRIKGVVQKALSFLPGGVRLNTALQRMVGELRAPEANFDAKLGDWQGLMALLAAAGRRSVDGAVMVEVGTGWYPTNPLLFALAGAREVHTYDIVRHLDEGLTRRLLAHLDARAARIAATAGVPVDAVEARIARWRAARGLDALLAEAGIRYHAPGDARATGLPDGAVDIVFSNSVLEHVDPALLPSLMAESRRLVGARGLAVHAVACNDHYAHFDRAISFVNYLRYDDAVWARWNNPLNYQNRLRAPDFIAAARAAGLEVVHEERAVRPGTREALAAMPVAARFAHYTPDDLAATTVNFAARRTRHPA
jgi:hypothetical protein